MISTFGTPVIKIQLITGAQNAARTQFKSEVLWSTKTAVVKIMSDEYLSVYTVSLSILKWKRNHSSLSIYRANSIKTA